MSVGIVRSLIYCCVGFILVNCAATQTTAEKPKVVENTDIRTNALDNRSYQYLTLNNGMQVVLISDPDSEQTVASLAVGVGSNQNPASQPGLAHFLEHMLFLGTEKYPQPSGFFKFVESKGGYTNAYTSTDHTNYYFTINQEYFDSALDRFSDYFKTPTFDPTYTDKERTAVDNEWSKGRGEDGWILRRVRGETGNPAHPLSQMSVGNLETLSDKPDSNLLAEMKQFYQTYYSANIMNLVLAGKQSLPELKALAEKHFSSIENKNIERPQVNVAGILPEQINQHIYYQPQKEQKLLLIEFPIGNNSKQWQKKANSYLSYLLSSEEPNTLGEYLRNNDLAVSSTVNVDEKFYGQDGFVQFRVQLTDKGIEAQNQIIAATLSYINLLKNQGIQQKYYDELKALSVDAFDTRSKSPLVQTSTYLARAMYEYPPAHLLDYTATFAEFDKAEIAKLFAQLNVNNMRLWHIYPTAQVDTPIPYYLGQYATAPISPAEQTLWQQLAAQIKLELPATNDLFNPELDINVPATLDKPTLVVETQGIEAWAFHSPEFQTNKGWLELIINTYIGDRDGQYKVASNLFKNLFEQHLIALLDKAGRAGTQVEVLQYSGGSLRIRMRGKAGNQSLLIEKIMRELAEFTAQPDKFKQALAQYQESLRNQAKQTPAQQTNRLLVQLMYQTLTDEQLLQASEYVSLNMVNQYKQDLLQRNHIMLFAYGAYSTATVSEMVEQIKPYLAQNREAIKRYRRPLIDIMAGEKLVYQQKVEHSDQAVLNAYIYPEKSEKVNQILNLINTHLRSEFFRQLRTEEQLGYQVQSMSFAWSDHPIFLMLVQSNNTDTDALKARFDRFLTEYQASLANLSEQDFLQTKQSLLAEYTQKPDNLIGEAQPYFNDFVDDKLTFDSKQKAIEALESIQLGDLMPVYQKMLLGKQQMELLIQLKGTGLN
ncbi:insulinase family protein [Catenovulum sp. 2E275]|uniref:insulinase family protein n=1 Tax=Catenovulum sp. 2E275 TaxID=2980497 RepID=UPI0021D03B49|nr:insulinase family protein [Catenovulum sp. 2E275]MCU4675073.1 insulinase family protein [Catenovulum sp. 2E275]